MYIFWMSRTMVVLSRYYFHIRKLVGFGLAHRWGGLEYNRSKSD